MKPKPTKEETELAKAARFGDEVSRAIVRAVRSPSPVGPDHELYYAVRMARIAAYHAFKARPDIKPPDSYARAVASFDSTR